MIPKEVISQIFEAADIYDVVGDYVSLTKNGSNYKGSCPFHNEKTASFVVSPTKGIYKCFGCGKGGNSAVDFVIMHEGISYPEALKLLAKKYGIVVPDVARNPEEEVKYNEIEALKITLRSASKLFQENLTLDSANYQYLLNRKIDEKSIQKFEIGLCTPNDINVLKSKQVQYENLLKSGIVKDGERGAYLYFKNRITFPIYSHNGTIVGFGGRVTDKNSKLAKYINSPETELYDKSKNLYGIFHAKESIRKQQSAIICEGYTDVISFHQAGFTNAVSASGTAFTASQAQLLARFYNREKKFKIVYLAFDPDKAGLKATDRAIKELLQLGFGVKVIVFPINYDPSDFINDFGPKETKQLVENAVDWFDYKCSLFEIGSSSAYEESEILESLVDTIVSIPCIITQDKYLRQASRLFSASHYAIYKLYYQKIQ